MNIRPVTVEFLRAGPRHNQLLSPLTQYLAVCGDSPAGVVNLPYEHAVFERRREELRYAITTESDDDSRLRGILDQTGREMSDILSLVPGLPGVLSSRVDSSEILNLRLVLSASELAALPFELSKIPAGGGAPPDNWLLLHANAPVCLTRHNRAVRSDNVKWPTRPRILFAYGENVPFQEHEDALKAALLPWTSGDAVLEQKWLTIVRNATLPKLNEVCRSDAFTHVHILAHGAPCGDTAFGVSLSDTVVSGRALAAALFDVTAKGVHRPTVVTLATCDSGGMGSPVYAPDVSVAHDLHEAGIPLVVASQFPLSTDGAREFVGEFYKEQLAGAHPLLSLYRARLTLHAHNSRRFHDWASLVIYEALPPNLTDQLYDVQYLQKSAVLDRALTSLEDACLNEAWTAAQHGSLVEEVERARQDLPDIGPYAAECVGLQAASWKRIAHVDYTMARRADVGSDDGQHYGESCYFNLERAAQAYESAAKSFLVNFEGSVHRKATLHWLLGQVLSLDAALGKALNMDYWTFARYSAMAELQQAHARGEAWGHGTIAELKLLRLTDPQLSDSEVAALQEEVVGHAAELVAQNGLISQPVFSTGRQFARYLEWWSQDDFARMMDRFDVPPKVVWRRDKGLLETARKALKVFHVDLERRKKRPQPAPKKPEPAAAPVGEKAAPTPPPPPTAGPVAARAEVATLPAPRAEGSSGAVFRVEMLPAANGDCLWIEYGDAKRPNRVLIDCGAESAAKLLLARTAELQDPVELFMLTHIDSDHIGGVLPFFRNRGKLAFQEVWFNAEPQLPPAVLGVMQGEQFAKILNDDTGLRSAWNRSAGEAKGVPAAIVRPDEGLPPTYTLPGGLRLTVLSPRPSELQDLAVVWRKELKKFKQQESHMLSAKAKPQPVKDLDQLDVEKLANAPWKKDPSVANGSSIAVLAEFDGRRALLTGDAHAPVVQESIGRLLAAMPGRPERLPVDLMKLAHHGSTNALTKELLGVIDCNRFMISSDGSKFYHPDREAVARVICFGGKSPRLFFNYRSEMNGFWGEEALRTKYGYSTEYPDGTPGKVVEL
jgi:beta-lactamase superfamily II metal-dependent hydrolase